MSPTGGCAAAGGTAADNSKGNKSIATYECCIFEPAQIYVGVSFLSGADSHGIVTSYRDGGLDKWQRQLKLSRLMCKESSTATYLASQASKAHNHQWQTSENRSGVP